MYIICVDLEKFWNIDRVVKNICNCFVVIVDAFQAARIVYSKSYFAHRKPVFPFGKKIIAHKPISKDFLFYSSMNQIFYFFSKVT